MRPLSVKVPAPVICTSDSKVARGPGLDSALAWTPFAVIAVRSGGRGRGLGPPSAGGDDVDTGGRGSWGRAPLGPWPAGREQPQGPGGGPPPRPGRRGPWSRPPRPVAAAVPHGGGAPPPATN